MENTVNNPLFKKQLFYEEKIFKNTMLAHLEMYKLEQSINKFNEFYELYIKDFSSMSEVFSYLEKYYLFLTTYIDEMHISNILSNVETEIIVNLQNALCIDCEYDKSLQKLVVGKKNPLYIIETISNYYNLTYNVRSFYAIDGRRYYIDFDKNNSNNNNDNPIHEDLNNLKSIELFPIDNTLCFQNQNIRFKLIDTCIDLKNKINLNNTNSVSNYNIAIFGNGIKNDTSIGYAKEYLEKYESIIIEKIDSFTHSNELGKTIFKNEKAQEEIYDISISSDIASLTNKYDIILFQELPALYKENRTRKELEQTKRNKINALQTLRKLLEISDVQSNRPKELDIFKNINTILNTFNEINEKGYVVDYSYSIDTPLLYSKKLSNYAFKTLNKYIFFYFPNMEHYPYLESNEYLNCKAELFNQKSSYKVGLPLLNDSAINLFSKHLNVSKDVQLNFNVSLYDILKFDEYIIANFLNKHHPQKSADIIKGLKDSYITLDFSNYKEEKEILYSFNLSFTSNDSLKIYCENYIKNLIKYLKESKDNRNTSIIINFKNTIFESAENLESIILSVIFDSVDFRHLVFSPKIESTEDNTQLPNNPLNIFNYKTSLYQIMNQINTTVFTDVYNHPKTDILSFFTQRNFNNKKFNETLINFVMDFHEQLKINSQLKHNFDLIND